MSFSETKSTGIFHPGVCVLYLQIQKSKRSISNTGPTMNSGRAVESGEWEFKGTDADEL